MEELHSIAQTLLIIILFEAADRGDNTLLHPRPVDIPICPWEYVGGD